jgi:hypothetical protein
MTASPAKEPGKEPRLYFMRALLTFPNDGLIEMR